MAKLWGQFRLARTPLIFFPSVKNLILTATDILNSEDRIKKLNVYSRISINRVLIIRGSVIRDPGVTKNIRHNYIVERNAFPVILRVYFV